VHYKHWFRVSGVQDSKSHISLTKIAMRGAHLANRSMHILNISKRVFKCT